MSGSVGVLAGDGELLEELLSRPGAGEDDLNVIPLAQAGEADQVLGKIKDADRLSHVDQKYFTTLPHRSSL